MLHEWKTVKPVVDGYYWYRKSEKDTPRIVHVAHQDRRVTFFIPWSENASVDISNISGQWAMAQRPPII